MKEKMYSKSLMSTSDDVNKEINKEDFEKRFKEEFTEEEKNKLSKLFRVNMDDFREFSKEEENETIEEIFENLISCWKKEKGSEEWPRGYPPQGMIFFWYDKNGVITLGIGVIDVTDKRIAMKKMEEMAKTNSFMFFAVSKKGKRFSEKADKASRNYFLHNAGYSVKELIKMDHNK